MPGGAVVRTIVVTGGSSGIGRAVAARFAAEGARVLITGRNAETVLKAAAQLDAAGPGTVLGLPCDSTDPAGLHDLADQAREGVNVLVNASGGLGNAEPCDDPLARLRAAWNADFTQNTLGAVLTTAALRHKLTPGAAVVSIGSIGAERRGGSYGAAKAALAAWNAFLSAELGPLGVTANVVSAGYVAGTGFFRGAMTAERHDALVAETHDKRPGTPEDIAETVHFLASLGARHITGQTIHVNGGAYTTR